MKENLENNDFIGSLSIAINKSGKNDYDYKPRAIIVRATKERLGLSENIPLPSPWTIEINPTLLCNQHCHVCSYKEDINKFKSLSKNIYGKERYGLTKESVISLLSEIKNVGITKGTYWSGGGEPLIWPYIVEAVKLASTFSEVFIQTNGILLNKFINNPENLSSIRLLSVSVYADNSELHKKITETNHFEKIINNILKISSLKQKNDLNLILNSKIMIDRINYIRTPEIVKFYRELGVDTIGLRLVQDYNYGGIGKRRNSVELTTKQKQNLYQIIQHSDVQDPTLQSFAESLKQVDTSSLVTDHCFNAIDGHFACVDAWGDVYLGNPEIGDSNFKIGNINSQKWSDIWKSEKHYEVIRKMENLHNAGGCKVALCRHVKANLGTQEYVDGKTDIPDEKNVMSSLGAFL